jgi:hypothetical protein
VALEERERERKKTILSFHKEKLRKHELNIPFRKKLFSPRSRRLCSVGGRLDNACVPRSQKLRLPAGNPHWTTHVVKFAACCIHLFHRHPFF